MTDITHIIPVSESSLHIESPICSCHPVAEVGQDGQTTWVHKPLQLDDLIDNLDVT